MPNHASVPKFLEHKLGALKIAGIYLLTASVWILYSDRLAASLAPDKDALVKMSLYKGWGFVIVTSMLLYWLVFRQMEKIRRNEELYRLLAENTGDAIWVLDLETRRFTYVSPAVQKLRGYSQQEVLAQPMEAALSPDSARFLEQVLPGRLADFRQGVQNTYIDQIDQPRKDGSLVSTETASLFFINPHTEHLEVYGISRDITERKRAEAATAYQAYLLANINDAVIATDENFNITAWNRAAEMLYGWTEAEVLGHSVRARLPSDFSDAQRAEALKRLNEAGQYVAEIRQTRSDGQRILVEGKTNALRDDTGRVTGYVSINRDITERKRNEAEIHRLNTELERRVLERTAELEAANKELEAFSYSVSHDLRAPLRAIDGYTSILLEDYGSALGEEGQRVGSVIRQEAQRMGQLIDDLLTFSRLGRKAIQPVEVNMTELVKSVFDDLTRLMGSREIEFRLGELHPVTGDALLLRQVCSNLLANALKFTAGKERAVIEVSSEESATEVIYSIRDNGAGFDMQYVDKLFGIFQRLHSESEFEGTGVGLAIVQRVIHRHHGRVWAEGWVEAGAVFHFALPRKDE